MIQPTGLGQPGHQHAQIGGRQAQEQVAQNAGGSPGRLSGLQEPDGFEAESGKGGIPAD